jgi:hypothetical protein
MDHARFHDFAFPALSAQPSGEFFSRASVLYVYRITINYDHHSTYE